MSATTVRPSAAKIVRRRTGNPPPLSAAVSDTLPIAGAYTSGALLEMSVGRNSRPLLPNVGSSWPSNASAPGAPSASAPHIPAAATKTAAARGSQRRPQRFDVCSLVAAPGDLNRDVIFALV
ncbi:MAG: hypothetical protein ACLP8S_26125 [Solirubrobacteraceae bacterium]